MVAAGNKFRALPLLQSSFVQYFDGQRVRWDQRWMDAWHYLNVWEPLRLEHWRQSLVWQLQGKWER